MSLATLLVLADGRLPAGGHAHSGGLETQVAAGRVRDIDELAGFLRGKLATAGLVTATFAAAACHRPENRAENRPEPPAESRAENRAESRAENRAESRAGNRAKSRTEIWAELDAGLDARTPSPALRKASRAQGRALLRAGRAMWPIPAIDREPHQPVALGALAAAAGLSPAEAAVAAAHGTVSGSASAAVRLLGLDPYAVHGLLARLAPDIDRIAAQAAARAGDPVDDLPAAGAPLLDIGAELHATWEVRLFAS